MTARHVQGFRWQTIAKSLFRAAFVCELAVGCASSGERDRPEHVADASVQCANRRVVPIQDVVARYQEHIETQIEAKYPEMRGIDLGVGVVMSKQHDGHVLIGYVPPNIIDGVFLIELNVCKLELISVGRGHVR